MLNPKLRDLPDQELLRGFRELTSNPFLVELKLRLKEDREAAITALESAEPGPEDVNYAVRTTRDLGKVNGMLLLFRMLDDITQGLTDRVKQKEGLNL